MTWKPTDEMVEAAINAIAEGFGPDLKKFSVGVLIAVQHLIAKEAVEKATKWRPTHRHVKGGLYQAVYQGKIEATLEPCIVYLASDHTVWVRPVDNFNERFVLLKRDEIDAAIRSLIPNPQEKQHDT